jgi:hypothetical protein
MRYLKTALLGGAILLFTTACNIQKQNGSTQSSNKLASCDQLSQQQTVADLGNINTTTYVLGQNAGYAPDDCHYAVSIYFNGSVPKTQTEQKSDVEVGTWVINTRTNSASRIAAANKLYDYNFKGWISNTQLELNSDNNDTIANYDITSNSVVSHTITALILKFNTKSDVQVAASATNNSDSACNLTKSTVQEFFNYPYACIRNGDAILNIAGYKKFTIHSTSPNTITVNGKVFEISDNNYSEIDL